MLGHEEWWVMRSLFRKSLERNGLDEPPNGFPTIRSLWGGLIAACESACNDDSSSGSESVPPKPFIVVLRLNFIVAALVGTSFISDALPISLTGDD